MDAAKPPLTYPQHVALDGNLAGLDLEDVVDDALEVSPQAHVVHAHGVRERKGRCEVACQGVPRGPQPEHGLLRGRGDHP